ncbi:DUF4157 domain-containing protein [Streptomyces sp. NPDC056470]|uniref:eCIS core domain-containing protein n=1 Tax=Streptomyces sp. NPDC056470 TaxID=3345831 RepID=UPI0036B28985
MSGTGHSTAASGLQGPGAPLEPGVRDQMSTSYGHDFSPVRVHVGPEAERATGELGALAYTVGNDVVFAQGAYDPLSRRGRSLIAHELAHVAQHGGHPSAPGFLRAHPSVAPPDADARLERQAHTASAFHARGEPLPASWRWERPAGPFLGRADMSWTQLEAKDQYTVLYADQTRTVREEQHSPGDPAGMVRVNLGTFVVPDSKGPWRDTYDAIAKAKGLQAVVKMTGSHPSSGLWEKRAPSKELRRLWLLRMQWPRDQAALWWKEAGGDASPKGTEFDPYVHGVQSQIDHVVELQLGGTNVPENLAPHDGPDNEDSGRTIARHVQQAATSVSAALHAKGRKRPDHVVLWFDSAVQAQSKEARPLDPPFASRTAGSALQAHFTAEADLKAGRRPSADDLKKAADAWAAYKRYPLASGTNRQDMRVPDKPAADGHDDIETSAVPENRAARELIAGVMLEKLTRPSSGKGAHTVTAWIDSDAHPVRGGSRLPIRIPKAEDKQLALDVKDPFTTGTLSLRGGKQEIRFLYPYLSTGRLTLSSTEQGLEGHGTLTPSVPLLSRVPITVDWDRSGFRGSAQAPADRLSLPPFRVTEAALALSIAPQLQATGHLAFALGSWVTGRLEAGVDPQGLFAKGRLVGRVPGLDEATGDVEYRPATGLTGFFVARASRPSGLVRGGEVRLDVGGGAWRIGGQIDVVLPGDSPARLTVRRAGERILYGGEALLKVPGLRPVNVAVSYDGERVTGTARTTFALLGAEGEIALRYRDGRFSGDGSVELRRGRFAGRLEAQLDEDGRISGRGTGSLTIRPGLVGTVGVEYGRDRKLRVSGELRFPPYRFLEPRGARHELFRHSLPDIPIFAIPLGIGAVGLVARIGGGLAVFYRFGPGEIRDMVIRGAFNPLEEDMNAELAAEARLVLPAEAGLEMFVRAGIGASVAIASATGGITLTGGVLLRGGLDAAARLAYAKGVLTFDTLARISVQPVLTLRIEADILIEAAVGGTWRFPYQLASYSYATGLEFGLIAPFHYQSDQPLRLPEARDIQWIVPQIDVGALANRVATQVRSGLGF